MTSRRCVEAPKEDVLTITVKTKEALLKCDVSQLIEALTETLDDIGAGRYHVEALRGTESIDCRESEEKTYLANVSFKVEALDDTDAMDQLESLLKGLAGFDGIDDVNEY